MTFPHSFEPTRKNRILAGACVGFFGGLLMVMVLMILYTLMDLGPLFPINLNATWTGVFLNPDGLNEQTLEGLVMHLSFTTFLGALWGAALIETPTPANCAVGGMIYALIVYFLINFWIGPHVNPLYTQLTRGATYLLAYLLFGVSFILYPRFFRRFSSTRSAL